MTYEEINKLLQNYINKKIDQQECMSQLLQEVSNNKLRYGLFMSDDEHFDEIFFHIYESLPLFLERINKYPSSHSYIFYCFVRQCKAFWKRTQQKKHSIQKAEITTAVELYKETQFLYKSDEYSSSLTLSAQKTEYKHQTSLSDTLDWSNKTRLQKIVFITTLKACHYITERMLYRISSYCTYTVDFLRTCIEQLDGELENKIKRRDFLKQSIGRSYHLKFRYYFQKSFLNRQTIQYADTENKQKVNELKWKTRLTFLSTNHHRVVPTNARLAQFIGISSRQIVRYLGEGKKVIPLLNIDFFD